MKLRPFTEPEKRFAIDKLSANIPLDEIVQSFSTLFTDLAEGVDPQEFRRVIKRRLMAYTSNKNMVWSDIIAERRANRANDVSDIMLIQERYRTEKRLIAIEKTEAIIRRVESGELDTETAKVMLAAWKQIRMDIDAYEKSAREHARVAALTSGTEPSGWLSNFDLPEEEV